MRKIENQTTREAQKTAQSVSPEFRAKKKFGFSDIEDDLLREKLLRIKGQYAHKHPDMDLMQLLHLLCDHELAPVAQRVRKNTTEAENKAGTKHKTEAKNKTETKAGSKAEVEAKAGAENKTEAKTMSETKKAQNNERPSASNRDLEASEGVTNNIADQIHAPSTQPQSKAQTKRNIWSRDNHQCTNCGSTYAIQEDHHFPKAAGGEYTEANMRLLCRNCNQRAAIEFYGMPKMDPHLEMDRHLKMEQGY
ncbi:MAG: HNH endonuclease [Bdellovibrionales bacterium]|nr:HNH endonuclease [Bdellovibrionales bacterium]